MRVAMNSHHALPVYKKNRIASLLCIFEILYLRQSKDSSFYRLILNGFVLFCGVYLYFTNIKRYDLILIYNCIEVHRVE